MNNKNSTGEDTITTKILKHNINVFAPVICKLVNSSIEENMFPDILKLSKVIPIFKNGCKTDPSNYRPITILSNFSKIFEKVIQLQLTEYLESNNLFYCNQYGFRKFHSTSCALMSVIIIIIIMKLY